MSEAERFLARWSRRKGEAAARPGLTKPAAASPGEEAGLLPAMPPETIITNDAELPPIETIESASDVTAFLAPGVPPELTRAALRRAWATDPAIRDFVGLSENAWDFNAPNGVPGFGALDPDQLRKLVDHFMREPKPAQPESATADPQSTVEGTIACPAPAALDPTAEITGAQGAETAEKPRKSARVRRHGTALPK